MSNKTRKIAEELGVKVMASGLLELLESGDLANDGENLGKVEEKLFDVGNILGTYCYAMAAGFNNAMDAHDNNTEEKEDGTL